MVDSLEDNSESKNQNENADNNHSCSYNFDLFDDITEDWEMPLGNIETNAENILGNLDQLIMEMGDSINVSFNKTKVKGLNLVRADRNYNAWMVRNDYDNFNISYFLFRPKKMILHKSEKEKDNPRNYVLLLTDESQPKISSKNNPEELIERIERRRINGKMEKEHIFYPKSHANKFDGYYLDIYNFHRNNSMILFFPNGSVYEELNERKKVFERFKL